MTHRPPALADVLAARPVLMDGGLSTQMETRGVHLDTALWSAQLLVDDPAAIRSAHADYFAAGAEIAITATYQASFEGFASLGLDRAAAARLMTDSITLAGRARDEAGDGAPRWVAASVGPYGAALADGSEYRGDYGRGVGELRSWHRPRLEVLLAAGPDLLAIETIPSAAEAEAILVEIDGTGMPAWLAITAIEVDGEVRTRTGERLADVFAMAADVDEVIAVGVNCCAPELGAAAMRAAATAGRPGVIYPNSGEGWDKTANRWTGSGSFDPDDVTGWIDAGARLVGGCCRVGPADIAAMRALLPVR